MTKALTLPSIKREDIHKENCYFNPGCALSIYKPDSEEKVLKILNDHMGQVKMHNICCQHDPNLPKESTIINNCAGCDRRFRSLYEGVNTISIWEVLDSMENLPLPDHTGLTVSVHDSCSYRPKPQVHEAVRSLLRKMNIQIVESAFSGSQSICCGDNFYGRIPLEAVHEFQKKRASQMPCQDVVVYCVSCIKAMTIGGKTPHHMVDLVLNEATDPQDTNLESYHEALQCYIDRH